MEHIYKVNVKDEALRGYVTYSISGGPNLDFWGVVALIQAKHRHIYEASIMAAFNVTLLDFCYR